MQRRPYHTKYDLRSEPRPWFQHGQGFGWKKDNAEAYIHVLRARDQAYARRLAEHLRQRSFDVWVDGRIESGEGW